MSRLVVTSRQGLLSDVVHDARHVGFALGTLLVAPQILIGGHPDRGEQFIHHFAEMRILPAFGSPRSILGRLGHVG